MDKQLGIEKKSWYFFRLQELVFEDQNLDSYDKLIYAVLSKYADYDTNICYPSLNTISKMADCSRPTTIKHINHLVKAGYIKKENRNSKKNTKKRISNLYKIKDLGYINNIKKYARENKNFKLLTKIDKRLKKHPIPTYDEIMNLYTEMKKKDKDKEMQDLYDRGWR